ncbi:MAG: T9SS type A sorting domain-containing protein [Flavobacteriales bacterium]|nr:T9SS type A sorting domain-containing protein [Flavobacteriales bacterium]
MNGQSVKEVNYTNEAIDISDLNFGVYIIKINTTAGMLTKRLVKK